MSHYALPGILAGFTKKFAPDLDFPVQVRAKPEVVSCNSAAPYRGQARESTDRKSAGNHDGRPASLGRENLSGEHQPPKNEVLQPVDHAGATVDGSPALTLPLQANYHPKASLDTNPGEGAAKQLGEAPSALCEVGIGGATALPTTAVGDRTSHHGTISQPGLKQTLALLKLGLTRWEIDYDEGEYYGSYDSRTTPDSWTVTNHERRFVTTREADAEWLCGVLNKEGVS